MSRPIRGQGSHLDFPISLKNINLLEDVEILLPVKFYQISFLQFQRRSQKSLSKAEAMAAILFFRSAQKNTNLVKDLEILLPLEFLPIRFSGFRGEVNNVSANQRPELPSWFSDRPKKHKLGRAHWDLASCQVSSHYPSVVPEKLKSVSANQSSGRPSCFSDQPKKHKLGRGHWDLACWQVSLNSVQRFQRRSWKCES